MKEEIKMPYTETDKIKTAERLADLRKESGLSYMQLSADINKRLGINISHTSLKDYEETDKIVHPKTFSKNMSIANLVALSEYYKVSFDYLLGKSDSKKRENIDVQKELGLNDIAIKVFRDGNSTKADEKNIGKPIVDWVNKSLSSEKRITHVSRLCRDLLEYGEIFNSNRKNTRDRNTKIRNGEIKDLPSQEEFIRLADKLDIERAINDATEKLLKNTSNRNFYIHVLDENDYVRERHEQICMEFDALLHLTIDETLINASRLFIKRKKK